MNNTGGGPPAGPPITTTTTTTDVIVIGAGAAGMTAAYDLINSGYTVSLLEASNRIGGRIKKEDTNNSPGSTFSKHFPLDLGGEWLMTNPNVLNTIVESSGQHPQNILNDIELWKWNVSTYYEYEDSSQTFVSYDYSTENIEEYKFVNYTWYDFFNDYLVPTIYDSIQFNCIVTEIDYSSITTTNTNATTTNTTDTTQENNDTIQVICNNDNENNENNNSTTISYYSASQVIVTVPLSVLKTNEKKEEEETEDGTTPTPTTRSTTTISFQPLISHRKRSAINSISIHPGIKVFLKFKSKFYYTEFGYSKYSNFKDHERYFYDVTLGQQHKQQQTTTSPNNNTSEENDDDEEHILELFAVGTPALEYIYYNDSYIISKILHELDIMYSNHNQNDTHIASESFTGEAIVQNWSTESYIWGAYSNYYYNNSYNLLRRLAYPIGNQQQQQEEENYQQYIFFAGEAYPVDWENGFVHTAAISGKAAAYQIIHGPKTPQFLCQLYNGINC